MSKEEQDKLAILVKSEMLEKAFEKIDTWDNAILGMMVEEDISEEDQQTEYDVSMSSVSMKNNFIIL